MNILMLASESVPFVKTGGLADVVGALCERLGKRHHDVRLVLPRYRGAKTGPIKELPYKLEIPVGDQVERVALFEGRLDSRVPVYFVDSHKYFDREGLYTDLTGAEYPDNAERFILFGRAALEVCKAVDFRPDVVHGHDWQAGLAPAYLASLYRFDAFFIPTASVFTIHNIAYQGLFPKDTVFQAGFSWMDFTPERLEYYGQFSFLKAALVFAHSLNTVSPSYAREVQSGNAFGRGMEGILKFRSKDFVGILNGLDVDLWDPAQDPLIAQRYDARSLEPRDECKKDLQKTLGLPLNPSAPLLGVVSRLDPQKGMDTLLALCPELLRRGAQVAVLGQGSTALQEAWRALADKHGAQVRYSRGFDEPLAHKIYAGADLFLMPSRFEPCGLTQMIALRYGAVPVVTPTGGLLDTVTPYLPSGDGVGFVARDLTVAAYGQALNEALRLYSDQPMAWKSLVRRGMARRFLWETSIDKYLDLYHMAREKKQRTP